MQKLKIKTLQDCYPSQIVNVFNQSFADYLLPFNLSEADFNTKIFAENIVLYNSVGVYFGNEIVGFILIGIDDYEGRSIAYNAGTGVIPKYRGNNLTTKMLDFLSPYLTQLNIQFQQLEVLTENKTAIKIYQKSGFQIQRKLSCFRGNIIEKKVSKSTIINEIVFSELLNIKNYNNQIPAYQNSINAIQRTLDKHIIYGAFIENKLIGFLVFSPNNSRIKQFGVQKEYRRNGVATSLFMKIKALVKEKEVQIINVDNTDIETLHFIDKIGLKRYIQQYEMNCEYAKN